jgi:rhamnosyltransferase subunit B
MHVIVTAIGSAGDINPMLMIASEIHARGHEVHFIANGYFEEKIRKAGLNFLALGGADLYEKAVNDPEIWDPQKAFSAVWRSQRDALPLNIELIESCLRKDTILLGSTLAFGSRIVQEKHHNKGSTVHLAPSCIISGHDPMAMPGMSLLPRMPLPVRKFMMSAIDSIWLDKVCRDDLNDIRASHGLSPIKSVMKNWMHSPDQVICAFPDWYAQPQPDWPQNTVMTGFPIYDRPEDQELTPELEAFLQNGNAPIVFTAGSAMAQSKKHFETAVIATRQAGMRAILVSAFPEQIPKSLPPEIIHVKYAPFSVLFPRAAVVQHHGGIGTSAQCLAAGVPHLITPFAHDQFDNAFRNSRLGVAKESNKLDAREWSNALSGLSSSSQVKNSCIEVKERIAKSPRATALITDALEELSQR